METPSAIHSPTISISRTNLHDLEDILTINRVAFGSEIEAELVDKLLVDPTASPLLSLIARDEEKKPLGHILFTKVTIDEFPDANAMILAPVAVVPSDQKKGIGSRMIEHGLEILKESDVDLVFVLGHPDYYPRCGFHPAGILGYLAPYPIPPIHANAWMVQELTPGIIQKTHGIIQCAQTFNKPEYWSE